MVNERRVVFDLILRLAWNYNSEGRIVAVATSLRPTSSPAGMTSTQSYNDERKKEKFAPQAQIFLFFSHQFLQAQSSSPKGNLLVS